MTDQLRDALGVALSLAEKVDAGWEAHGALLRRDPVEHEDVFALWAETTATEESFTEAAVNFLRTHGPAIAERLEADAKDAERYRWLMEHRNARRNDVPALVIPWDYMGSCPDIVNEHLDAAIDAASAVKAGDNK